MRRRPPRHGADDLKAETGRDEPGADHGEDGEGAHHDVLATKGQGEHLWPRARSPCRDRCGVNSLLSRSSARPSRTPQERHDPEGRFDPE